MAPLLTGAVFRLQSFASRYIPGILSMSSSLIGRAARDILIASPSLYLSYCGKKISFHPYCRLLILRVTSDWLPICNCMMYTPGASEDVSHDKRC